jgi:hypothetical protein
MLRCPGTQRLLQSWSKEAQLLLELETYLGIIHIMLGFFRHAESSYLVVEAFAQISRENWDARKYSRVVVHENIL